MMIAIGIVVCFIACWLWVKFVFSIFGLINKKRVPVLNPYIEAQKLIIENDKNYEDYLNWMDKKGSGVPLEKIMTKEDHKAQSQINKLI